MALCEVYVSVPMPETLAIRLRSMAERDCSSLAATARRLIARGVASEQILEQGGLPVAQTGNVGISEQP